MKTQLFAVIVNGTPTPDGHLDLTPDAARALVGAEIGLTNDNGAYVLDRGTVTKVTLDGVVFAPPGGERLNAGAIYLATR